MLIDQIKQAAMLAGNYINKALADLETLQIEEKSPNSLVSEVDKNAEKMIVNALQSLIPHAGFITEEHMTTQSLAEYTWIIDPLDGTTNFLNAVPCFSVSIALMHHQRVISGVVYEISRKELFHAQLGHGAYLNDKRICVNQDKEFSEILIATGFPYDSEDEIDTYLSIIKNCQLASKGVRRFGSAAVDLCYTAAGRFGLYYESKLNVWDVAAGALIAQEAGAKLCDYSGGENFLFGREIVATAPQHKDRILKIIQKEFNKSLS